MLAALKLAFGMHNSYCVIAHQVAQIRFMFAKILFTRPKGNIMFKFRNVTTGYNSIALATFAICGINSIALAAPSAQFKGEMSYKLPVDSPELEPYSTFRTDNFTIKTNENNKFLMTYPMPRDMTAGNPYYVVMSEVSRAGTKISFDGYMGSAVCDVPADWDTARCEYKFDHEYQSQVSETAATGFLDTKYKGDPSLPLRKKVIVNQLLKNNDSFGFAFPKNSNCSGCELGRGNWMAQYSTKTGETVDSEMEIMLDEGRYYNNSGSGKLSKIVYTGNTARGVWTWGSSVGWFEFNFDANGDRSFKGSWGFGNAGSPKVGFWNAQ